MNKENLDFEARQILEDLSIPKHKRDTNELLDLLAPKRRKLTDREIFVFGEDSRWN